MEKSNIKCLGFIMDGNRRWAKERGLETTEGHSRGNEVMKNCVEWVKDEEIPHAVFYAFSTENWKRKKSEVEHLMQLFYKGLKEILENNEKEIEDKKIRVRIIGRKEDFSLELQELMNELEERSSQYKNTTIWIALSYGGRTEIVEAVNKAIKAGKNLSEDDFEKLLWTVEMPNPDMIVRTSGEHRLSNFLTWRSVYSELYFIDKHWPALTKDDFVDILKEYKSRERRHGA